jgi:hypothetical protein
MALEWDITKIKNHKKVCFTETDKKDENGKPLVRLKPMTEALIWATIVVDLGEITEANYREFAWRLRLYSATTGHKLLWRRTKKGKREYDPSEDDVKRHIGLRCNVCDQPTTKFMTKLRRVWKEQLR